MAFEFYRRNRCGVTEYDPVTRIFRWSGKSGPINRETAPGSGVYEAGIDLELIRTNVPRLNGYLITAADWHHAIQTQAPTDDQYAIGTVAFGGRQGEHWIVSRFRGLAWVDWPNRDYQMIASASYDPAKLSKQTSECTLAGETFRLDTAGSWIELMTTPNGGSVSMRMKMSPLGLKWIIEVDELAREYYQTNNPPPNANWYLTVLFDVDLDDREGFPKAKRLFRGTDSVDLDDPNLDVDDDGERFTWRDELGQFLAFMPLDSLRVGPPGSISEGRLPVRLSLRKKLYRKDGNVYLGVGVRAGDLASKPGELVFDPTYIIAETAEDGYSEEKRPKERVQPSEAKWGMFLLGWLGFLRHFDGGWIFETAIPQGATIQTATLEIERESTEYYATPSGDFYGYDVDSPADFNSSHTHRVSDHETRTSASVASTIPNQDPYTSPSLVSIVQEIVDRSGFNGRLGITWRSDGTKAWFHWSDYSDAAADAAELTVTWQAGGIEKPVGLASETDTAFTITALKTQSIGLPSEADSALALAVAKTLGVGLAAESASAFALNASKARAVALAGESDTGLAVAKTKAQTVGLPSEADSALAAIAAKTKALGLSTEADSTFALEIAKLKALGLPIETDTGLTVTIRRTRSAGLSIEADSAFVAAPIKGTLLGLAAETDSALAVTSAKLKELGLSIETDAAFPVTITGETIVGIGLASETDSAPAISKAKLQSLGLALESDQALGTVPMRTLIIGLSLETDSGLAVTIGRALPLGLSIELDTGLILSSAKLKTVGLALETDQGFAVTPLRILSIGLPTETDMAFPLTISKLRELGLPIEIDSALSLIYLAAIGTMLAVIEVRPAIDAEVEISPRIGAILETKSRLDAEVEISPRIGAILETKSRLNAKIKVEPD
jgi:hypothetical protein